MARKRHCAWRGEASALSAYISIDKNAEKWAYVLQADLYNKLSQSKVIQEAALRSGIAKGAINAAWDAIGEVIFFCSFEHALIPSRLGKADASIALLSLFVHFSHAREKEPKSALPPRPPR